MSPKRMMNLFLLPSLFFLLFVSVAFAADGPVLTVGTFSLNEKEVLELMATTTDGNQMMVGLMLSQSSLPERKEMLEQMSHALLFAEAAKAKGMEVRPDIAFRIKWQTMQILTQAYFEQNASKWDMSEKAVRDYYDTHKDEFYEAPAANTRHILAQTEGDALNAAMEVYRTKDFAKVAAEYSRDPNTAQRGGDLGWIEKGMTVQPVEDAIESASVGSLVGPVESDYGWHIIEVTERRQGRELTFEESVDRAAQALQRKYFEKELQDLESKYEVKIDEDALGNLGGIPAPEAAN